MENPIISSIQELQVEESRAILLQDSFMPFLEEINERKSKSMSINIISIEQKKDMEDARQARIYLKGIRVNADKVRERLKEGPLREGQAIQKVYNVIESLIKPLEEHLKKQEDFEVLYRKQKKEEIKQERTEQLKQYEVNTDFVKLEDMTTEQFEIYLQEQKTAHEERQEAKRILEQQEKENAIKAQQLAEENERLRLQNKLQLEEIERQNQEKLQAEKKQQEEEANKYRAEQEAKAKQEREDAEKLKLQQDISYKAFLAVHGCTVETQANFTTKKLENGTIILYEKVAEYNPITTNYAPF